MFEPKRGWHLSYKIKYTANTSYDIVLISPNTYTGTGTPPSVGSAWICGFGKWSNTAATQFFVQTVTQGGSGQWLELGSFDEYHKIDYIYVPQKSKLYYFFDNEYINSMTLNMTERLGFADIFVSPNCAMKECVMLQAEDIGADDYTTVLLTGDYYSVPCMDYLGNKFTINGAPSLSASEKDPYLYFNGASYLSWAEDTKISLGGQSFTIDFYYSCVAGGNKTRSIFGMFTGYKNGANPRIRTDSAYCDTGAVNPFLYIGDYSAASVSRMGPNYYDNRWTHIAYCYDHDLKTMKIFIDGDLRQTKTDIDLTDPIEFNYFEIGWGDYQEYYIGKLRNFRVSKGISRYKDSFDAKALLPENDGPELSDIITLPVGNLEYQKNTFRWVGTPPATPIVPVTNTNESKFGSAIPFNGAGYLANQYGITLGGRDFTIDGWFNMSSSSGSYARIFAIWNTTGSNADSIHIERYSTSASSTLIIMGRQSAEGFTTSYNTLYHFAVVYEHDKSTGKLYLNGNLTATISVTVPETTYKNFCLSKSNYETGHTTPFIGYIDEFRISDGIARYTQNFTPPTARSVADQYTKILLHGNDSFYTHGLTMEDGLGNICYAQNPLSIVQNETYGKFGSALYIPYRQGGMVSTTPAFVFSGQDFTVDFWCYTLAATGYGGNNYPTFFEFIEENSVNNNTYTRAGLRMSAAGTLASTIVNDSTATDASVSITMINTLHHFAIVHQSGVFKTYVDGVLKISSTASLSSGNYYIEIGVNQAGNHNNDFLHFTNFSGYISEFRISTVARWTADFTPPTSKYTVDSSTFSLLHFDTWFNKDECSNVLWQQLKKPIVYNTDVVPLTGGYSLFFDKGAQLIYKDITLGGKDFTIEGWARFSSSSGSYARIFEYIVSPANTDSGLLLLRNGTGNGVYFHLATSSAVGHYTVGYDTWFHWAITYDHTAKVLRSYVNGKRTASGSYTFERRTTSFIFGRSTWLGDGFFCGYMSDFRITDGIRRYQGDFIVPSVYTWQKTLPEGLATSDYMINLLNLSSLISNPMTKGTLTTSPMKILQTMKDEDIIRNSMTTSGQIKTLSDGEIFAYYNDTGEIMRLPSVIKTSFGSNGSNWRPVITDIDYTQVTSGETAWASAANDYNTTYTPVTTAFKWNDNTEGQKSFPWAIINILTVSTSSISLNPAHNKATYTVSSASGGALSYTPTDGTYYTQNLSGTTVTVWRKKTGSQTASVTTAATLDYPTKSLNTTVSVSAIDEYTLCYLKLASNLTDLISGSTWKILNCGSDQAPCYSGRIIYNNKQSFDLSKAWEVEFDWKYIGNCGPDWNVVFGFGYHYSINSTDNCSFSIHLGGSGSMSKYYDVWKHFKIVHADGDSDCTVTMDDTIIERSGSPYYAFGNPPPTSKAGFYIGGGGFMSQLSIRLKNFKIQAYLAGATTQSSLDFPFSTDLTGTGDIKITGMVSGAIYDESTQLSYVTETAPIYTDAGDPTTQTTKCLGVTLYRYLHRNKKITFGGENDFTIECWANLSTSSQSWGRIWEIAATNANNSTVIELTRDSTSQDIVVYQFGNYRIRVSGLMNSMHHFAHTYRHDTKENKLYVDGVCRGTFVLEVPETERDIYLGHSTFSNNESSVLNIREFRISKILRYTGDFRPTNVEYDLTGPTAISNPNMTVYAFEDKVRPYIDETYIMPPIYTATEAGTYSHLYYLRDTLHHCWDDGTIEPKTFSYTIPAGSSLSNYDAWTTDLGNITGNYVVNLSTLLKSGQEQFIYDSSQACIMSGPSSYHINNARSDYWIRVKPTVDLYLSVEAMSSSEGGYDFGVIAVTPYRSKVGRGASTVAGGVVIYRNSSGTFSNYTTTLLANTTYYIGLHYAKDGSAHNGEDRIKIRDIRMGATNTSLVSSTRDILWYIGTPTFSTDQYKFGTKSLLATNGYLQASAFPLPESWTIEFWEYVPSSLNSFLQEMISIYPSAGSGTGGTSILYHNHNYPTFWYGNGSTVLHSDIQFGNYLRDQWVHRAIVKSGTTFYFFENGTLYNTLTTTATTTNYTNTWLLGIGGRNGWNRNFNGYLDGIRISSIARWTNNFTPSNSKYGVDGNTLLLYYAS